MIFMSFESQYATSGFRMHGYYWCKMFSPTTYPLVRVHPLQSTDGRTTRTNSSTVT